MPFTLGVPSTLLLLAGLGYGSDNFSLTHVLPNVQASALNCVWSDPQRDVRCDSQQYSWDGQYPPCSLYQYADAAPIPCHGQVGAAHCQYEGDHAQSAPPQAASWHIHVFFPNPRCTNCSAPFTVERPHFTYKEALEFRKAISAQLNSFTEFIKGTPPRDPINTTRALLEPSYNQCGDVYNIVAGAPANYHREPCIFEVDDVKEGGPFTDPHTKKGYPNYSFLLPGDLWLPGLLEMMKKWLRSQVGEHGSYSEYDVFIHPNTGCEVRDHAEDKSVDWMGSRYPLLTEVFSCRALGCNQACPHNKPVHPLAPPANCSEARSQEVVVV